MKKVIHRHGGKRQGAGRKATGNAPMRSFRMSDEIYDRVIKWAKKQPDSPKFGTAIRQLVEFALDRWK